MGGGGGGGHRAREQLLRLLQIPLCQPPRPPSARPPAPAPDLRAGPTKLLAAYKAAALPQPALPPPGGGGGGARGRAGHRGVAVLEELAEASDGRRRQHLVPRERGAEGRLGARHVAKHPSEKNLNPPP